MKKIAITLVGTAFVFGAYSVNAQPAPAAKPAGVKEDAAKVAKDKIGIKEEQKKIEGVKEKIKEEKALIKVDQKKLHKDVKAGADGATVAGDKDQVKKDKKENKK